MLITAQINSSVTNVGGWGACPLRGTLNSTTYDSLENKEYIKQVNKQYIETYNNPDSVTTAQDKLWLLSCSEIWNNGRDGGSYGRAVAKEGEQYKYYKNINATSDVGNQNIVKKHNKSTVDWWIRSPYIGNSGYFGYVSNYGYCDTTSPYQYYGIASGFSI